jgi:hypothetical protein
MEYYDFSSDEDPVRREQVARRVGLELPKTVDVEVEPETASDSAAELGRGRVPGSES